MYNNIFANPQTGENAFPNLISSAVIITILCAIVMAIIGFLLIYFLQKMVEKRNKEKELVLEEKTIEQEKDV